VILSNTTFRDAEVYARDFETLGWTRWIDACVTSVDAGCRKPDPTIFQMAIRAAGTSAKRCVMIGDSEEADILPATALGMRTIRILENSGTGSAADAIANSLIEVLDTVRLWANTAP
jgi:putative hydrolase of the HAD superfamily